MTAPDPSVLLDLAERCERETGPNEALDSDIALAVGWTFRKRAEIWFCADYDDDRYVWVMPNAPMYHHEGRAWIDSGYYHPDGPPQLTGSIDAAMTLVRELSMWSVCGKAATPALALCAAALRARSTDTGGK